MCLIKRYKQDIKKGTRTKICSRFEFPLVSKNDSIQFIVYLFSTNIPLLLQCLDFNKIIPKEYPESFDPVSVDSVYNLRFIVIHEGKKFQEGHYYGYFRNLASRRWWKLDDEDVKEVHEDVVLDDAYAGDSCAFMLQYVL